MQDTPQVFIIGKISGAKYFEHTKLYVKYSIKRGDKWNLVSGKEEGNIKFKIYYKVKLFNPKPIMANMCLSNIHLI